MSKNFNLVTDIENVIPFSENIEENIFSHIEVFVTGYTQFLITDLIDSNNNTIDSDIKVEIEIKKYDIDNKDDSNVNDKDYIEYIPFQAHETCYSKRNSQQGDRYYIKFIFYNADAYPGIKKLLKKSKKDFFKKIEKEVSSVFDKYTVFTGGKNAKYPDIAIYKNENHFNAWIKENLKIDSDSCLNKIVNLLRFKNPNDYNIDIDQMIEMLKNQIYSDKYRITTELFEKYDIILKTCQMKDRFHIDLLLKENVLQKHIENIKDNHSYETTSSWLTLFTQDRFILQLDEYKTDFLKAIEPVKDIKSSYRQKLSKQCFVIVKQLYKDDPDKNILVEQINKLTLPGNQSLYNNSFYIKALYAVFSETNVSKSIDDFMINFIDNYFKKSLNTNEGFPLWEKFVNIRNEISKTIQLSRNNDITYVKEIAEYCIPGQISKELREDLPKYLNETMKLYENSNSENLLKRNAYLKKFNNFCDEISINHKDDHYLDNAFQILCSDDYKNNINKFILNNFITLFENNANVLNNSKIDNAFEFTKSLVSFQEQEKKIIIDHVRKLDIKSKEDNYLKQLLKVLGYKNNTFLTQLISINDSDIHNQDEFWAYIFDILYFWENKKICIRLVLTMCNAICYHSIKEMASTKKQWKHTIFKRFYKLLDDFEKEVEKNALKKEFRQKLIQDIVLLFGNPMPENVYINTVDLCIIVFSDMIKELKTMENLINFATIYEENSHYWINTIITICYMRNIGIQSYQKPLTDFVYRLTLKTIKHSTSIIDQQKNEYLIQSFKDYCGDDMINKLINEIDDNENHLEEKIKLISQLFSNTKSLPIQKYKVFYDYKPHNDSMKLIFIKISLKLLKKSIYRNKDCFEPIKNDILNLYHNDIVKNINCDKKEARQNLSIIHKVLNIDFDC